MDWNKLLSTKRVSDFCAPVQFSKSQFLDPRSEFERDCDQIIYSYPFRRLQDKTQTIPFPEFDFVHTRLTHSLEVSTIGRSLGKMVFEIIKDEITDKLLSGSDIGALVAAACFAHDIGNPPFGHSGEKSISIFFEPDPWDYGLEYDGYYKYNISDKSWTTKITWKNVPRSLSNEYLTNVSKMHYYLNRFEGNANGFRILTNNCGKGINPTYAMLGTFCKYPRESFIREDLNYSFDRKEAPKELSKYGFFQSEKEIFNDLAIELGLIKISKAVDDIAYCRHPLSYLMEAADDIAYRIIDFEDACRLNIIGFYTVYSKMSPREALLNIAQIDNRFSIDHLNSLIKDDINITGELSYLRACAINVLIHSCFEIYKKNYKLIMQGKFNYSLIDKIENIKINNSLSFMTDLIRKYVYNYKSVLEAEAAGFQVLNGLVSAFAKSAKLCISCGEEKNAWEIKIEQLLPEDYRPSEESKFGLIDPSEIYKRYLKILDFISGMTDGYALDKYRKINGIIVPGL